MERVYFNSRIRGQSRTILKKTTSGRTRIAKPSMSSFQIFSATQIFDHGVRVVAGRAVHQDGRQLRHDRTDERKFRSCAVSRGS